MQEGWPCRSMKAFVQGFLSAPWHRAPAVQRLALELSLNGAGEAVAELLNALPALRSLQLGPSCSLDADVLASLASAQALAQLTCLEFEGARAETWSLAPLVSSARQLQVLDLSDSDFGDADAQQLAAASLGPLLLSRLAFRRCRLRTPAGAVAVARILNSFGKVRHFSIQANAWRAEAHRAFAEQLAAPAAEGLLSLQAGYGAQPVPEAFSEQGRRLHFLSHFGVGLWLSAVLLRLERLQELRLERLPVGVVTFQILRRRLREPLALQTLILWGCTGLTEWQAGRELAGFLTNCPHLERLDLAQSDATEAFLREIDSFRDACPGDKRCESLLQAIDVVEERLVMPKLPPQLKQQLFKTPKLRQHLAMASSPRVERESELEATQAQSLLDLAELSGPDSAGANN
ncbi:unnamed protein product [Effrenium voratum]|uniref:Uncharacterized protein n=1 Tax=Effrenium voratum TaxID=2562239 RepID=A0AA36JTN1_9DINO|nr:unnamed protein product [Effrenium voratum]